MILHFFREDGGRVGTGKPKSSSQIQKLTSRKEVSTKTTVFRMGWGGPSALREALRRGFLEETKPKQRSRMRAAPVENVKCTANPKSASLVEPRSFENLVSRTFALRRGSSDAT